MPTNKHVIALDPGERTGWASARMGPDQIEITGYGTLPRREMALHLAASQAVASLSVPEEFAAVAARTRLYDRMVWESWSPRPDKTTGSMEWIKGDKLLSARHVGHFELIAWLSGCETREYGPDRKTGFQLTMPPQIVAIQREQSEQHPKDALMHLWGDFYVNYFSATKTPEECVVC